MDAVVDYRLAKRAALSGFRYGGLSVFEVCDAHPELIRAGTHIGRRLSRACPVCRGDGLREVRYVYGESLRHLSGRVVYPEDMVAQLSLKYDEFRCYAVEVCIDCAWNHLIACYLVGRRHQRRGAMRRAGAASD